MLKKKRISGLGIQLALSLVCIITGALLLFTKEVNAVNLSIVFCVALIFAGAAALFIFFLTDAYRSPSDYSFTVGVLLLILGVCGIIRIETLSAYFYTCTGILSLVTGSMMLRSAVRYGAENSSLAPIQSVFSIVVILCSAAVIVGFDPIPGDGSVFPEVTLLVSGILSVLGLALGWFRSRIAAGNTEEEAETE